MVEKEGIKKMIKAQSLIQSIYLCVVLMLLIGSLFLLSDLKGKLLHHYDGLNDHVYQHLKLKDYYLDNEDLLLSSAQYSYSEMKLDVAVKCTDWGVYKMFQLSTNKLDFKDSLDSFWKIKSKPNAIYALRTIDKGFALKYKGNVTLAGNVMLPEKSFQSGGLRSVIGTPAKLIFKDSYVKTTQVLPLLKDEFEIPEVDEEFRFRESEINTSLFINSFQKPSIEILLENRKLTNVELRGNIIIKSASTLELDSTSIIDECLIIAPKVIVNRGFQGNVQILATESIDVQENVQLNAGTTLYLKSSGSKGFVKLGKNVVLNGNVVIVEHADQSLNETFSRLIMSEKVQLNGDVYCDGVSFLKGEINGHVYSASVGTLKGSEESLNVISDVVINLPKLNNSRGLQMEDVDRKSYYSLVSKSY